MAWGFGIVVVPGYQHTEASASVLVNSPAYRSFGFGAGESPTYRSSGFGAGESAWIHRGQVSPGVERHALPQVIGSSACEILPFKAWP